MDSILLGIPTLNRYDLLECLIASAEAGTIKPKGYVIIDNGGRWQPTQLPDNCQIVRPERNLGVAASWNYLLRCSDSEPIVISNDDISLAPTSFAEILSALQSGALLVNAYGFALFAQTPECTRRVGYYDEEFYPAYYEDTDYERRCRIAGVERMELKPSAQHVGWATSRAMNDELSQHFAWQRNNYEYYMRKWGGPLGSERFLLPFDGKALQERATKTSVPIWNVLNHIARRIGAKRYLEIGTMSGDSLERIDVTEKWGVGPQLTHGAVQMMRVRRPPVATALLRMTSLTFFDTVIVPDLDLVFIDGDHRADLVYEEVMRSLPLLSSTGIIVLHDCNPQSEPVQRIPTTPGDLPVGDWTGDVWKAVARLRREGVHDVCTVDIDWGCAVIRPYRGQGAIDLPAPAELTYAMLEQDRDKLLGLVSVDDFLRRF
jgi:GT2 family glycosyltransferase